MSNNEFQNILANIKDTQIKNMKVPPKHENFFADLGLFLLHYKRIAPGASIQLIDCQYYGLYPLNEDDIALTIQATFQVDGVDEPIATKGYLIPTNPMEQLDAVPSKGDNIDVDIQIPDTLVSIDGSHVAVTLKKGRYKEQFLPLLLNSYQTAEY
ncbi:hypothetical protein MJH12_11190 [bacterium]|nr:hypothetical protein [bacterium]